MTDPTPDPTRRGIVLDGVTKTFPGSTVPAVAPLDLTFGAGEITVLIGPSGCGKTTTLRMINRLIEPTAGTITIDGTDVRDRPLTDLRRSIGYVIQQVGLFPHRTIGQNIATVPKLLGWPRARVEDRVNELVDLVGIDRDLLGRYPAELSGGQQQRIGVARALAADPPVLLMDEPFGAVDPIVRTRLQHELLALQERLHKTIVLVTHDLDEAITLGDRVALLNVGGIVEQFDAPDRLLAAPANAFVEDFLGHDRSIRRLTIGRVRDLAVDASAGPVVALDAPRDRIEAVVAAEPGGWIGLVEGDRFVGWVPAEDLAAAAVAGDLARLAPEPPAATVTPETTLRETLDVILTARTSAAVVLDADRFAGIVSLETIRAGLAG
jgi:osmoprotectant transport system ATP-binding protein